MTKNNVSREEQFQLVPTVIGVRRSELKELSFDELKEVLRMKEIQFDELLVRKRIVQ